MIIARGGCMSELKKITEQTLVPISLVILLFGGVFWLTTMYSSLSTNTKDIFEMKANIKEDKKDTQEKFDKILNELYYLKGAVNSKAKKGE
jgi:predicted RND superfamily exporter protein